MPKTLIIAEKPSVARDIAQIICAGWQRQEGYLENDRYIVTWAIGHLVTLAEPEDYAPELKKWSMDTLPIIPDKFKLVPVSNTAGQFRIVKSLLHRPDVQEVINACDAGREGELIFRYILALAGVKDKQIKRLWLSETTPAAVKSAFASLLLASAKENLGRAAEARSQADWLVGMNATRAFTVRHGELLSVGRVQTPTLYLLVRREQEIRNFQPQKYWELAATFDSILGSYPGRWFDRETGNSRLDSLEKAAQLVRKVLGQPGKVIQLEQKEVTEEPPQLFNLNDLQKEANRVYGMTAQKALSIAQSLYEKKLLTYPRTDSRHISTAIAADMTGRVSAAAAFLGIVSPSPLPHPGKRNGKRYVDDSKVTDHHAIIPTDQVPKEITDDERKIYDLVARRFLAMFYPAARYLKTSVVTETAGELFRSQGRVELEAGWKVLQQKAAEEEKDDEDETTALPPLKQGQDVQTKAAKPVEKTTRPPKRYNDASLLAVMETAGRLIDDDELRSAMQGHGLGTPATRAAIIERLIKVGYVERQKKALVPTAKGEKLIELVPEVVKSPEMTAKWEQALADIEAGKLSAEDFMRNIKQFTGEIVALVKGQEKADVKALTRTVVGKCPLCGKDVVEGKKGFGCRGWKDGCKFVIWKEVAGKKITAKQAETLLAGKQTGVMKGFKSKAGKEFSAALKLAAGGKIEFIFERSKSNAVH
ncbi:DNA topoisomerase III [Desulfurispora thermophila]|uniref:DNA topoisomerase III n=1 Tax=Desulfurispora thermophila TaxID=265470 RepID=UPI00036F13D3|nr:DNA topoisomerase III [Desulfurispora thermophila]